MSRNEFLNWYFRFGLRAESEPIGQILGDFTKEVSERRNKIKHDLGIKT
jgi:hypothetical protein